MMIPRFEYSLFEDYTHVVGGDWDRKILNKKIDFLYDSQGKEYYHPRTERHSLKRYLLPFDKYTYYTCSKKHFQEGLAWEDTEIYQFFIDKIDEGVNITRFETQQEVNNHLSYFDSLYENIKENGYKSQSELKNNKFKKRMKRGYEEMGELNLCLAVNNFLLENEVFFAYESQLMECD